MVAGARSLLYCDLCDTMDARYWKYDMIAAYKIQITPKHSRLQIRNSNVVEERDE